jgi:hypothetical protein
MINYYKTSETKLSSNLSALPTSPRIFPNQPSNPNQKTSNIMRLKSTSLTLAAAAVLAALPLANAQNVTATTDPVGFVTMNITAGAGSAKKITFVSIPLLDTASITGQAVGTITSFTSNSVSNSSAGWTPGALSLAASPYLIHITSGAAQGAMFLVSSTVNNTSTSVTISSDDTANTDLTTIGLANGDGYKIIPCDTLASLFGTPATSGVQGGANATVSDTIQIIFNGSTKTYFYSTTNNRWSQVTLGTPDASNTPLRPFVGLQYGRLPATPLVITTTGSVPTTSREVPVKNAGLTLLSQYWPVDSTLASLNINSISSWTSGANATVADTVQVNTSGTTKTFFFNGTDWKQVTLGSPTKNDESIPVGSSVILNQKGSASGYSVYNQNLPYSL